MVGYVIGGAVGLIVGAVLGLIVVRRAREAPDLERIESETAEAVAQARQEATEEAEKAHTQVKEEAETEFGERHTALREREDRLHKREEGVGQRDAQLARSEKKVGRREKELTRREDRLESQETTVKQVLDEHRERLEAVAGFSQNEAREQLVEEFRDDARKACVDEVRGIEQEARSLAEERARMVVSAAIQRYASEHVKDRTVVAVSLPSEDMKGRIIGREGRNIRAFEAASGCDVVIDDSPDTVIVSCFNPERREVGRLALERLLVDGRIHPARIEEVVSRVRKEMAQVVRQHGEQAALELEVTGLHPEVIKALGRLHFVTSFAQNVLRHSVEVGVLAGLMAEELGLKRKDAVRTGLLHAVGKSIGHEQEGDYTTVGAAFCRKHGESKAIVLAIRGHLDPALQTTVLAQLVGAAKALSAGRPGARCDALAATISRMEDIEALARDFEGVETCYALRTGQELRVVVDNARVSDRDADLLSRDIARRIEQEASYSGQMQVNVIRATRAVHYAR